MPRPTFFFSYLPPTRSHIISSPRATNNTTPPPIPRHSDPPNSNSATSPHTPRLLLRKFPFFLPNVVRLDPPSIFHPAPASSPVLVLIVFPSVPFARPSVPRIYPTPLSPLCTLLRWCPFNFFYSLAPSPPPLLGVWEKMRTIDVATALLRPDSEPDSNTSEAQSGVVQLALVLLNTV